MDVVINFAVDKFLARCVYVNVLEATDQIYTDSDASDLQKKCKLSEKQGEFLAELNFLRVKNVRQWLPTGSFGKRQIIVSFKLNKEDQYEKAQRVFQSTISDCQSWEKGLFCS